MIAEFGIPLETGPHFQVLEPIGYLDSLTLCENARIVVTEGIFEFLDEDEARAVVAVAWLCAFVPPFVVMQWFLSPASALLGAVLLGIAVLLLRHRLFARQRSFTVLDQR